MGDFNIDLVYVCKNIIVGCIYRHPCMHLSEFNNIYLKDFLENLSHENKTIVIMGDLDLVMYTQ